MGMPPAAKKVTFTIYRLTDATSTYIGITTQALSTRLRQHKQDAKLDGSCAITAKLCQKKFPCFCHPKMPSQTPKVAKPPRPLDPNKVLRGHY